MEPCNKEQAPQLEFSLGGGFSCRIIPGAGEEELADFIDNLDYLSAWFPTSTMGQAYWEELAKKAEEASADRTFFNDGADISREIYEMLRKQYGTDRYAASRLLARLWKLTAGGIREAVEGMGQDNKGCHDGGSYNIYLLAEKEGQPVAVLWLEGDGDSIMLEIRQWAEGFDNEKQEQLYRNFSQALLHAPDDIAVCRIVMEDPEREAFPFEYGWDGKDFLGCEPQEVLYWIEKRRKKAELIRKAFAKVEAHPFHHLEREFRERIIRELSRYIRIYQPEVMACADFRLTMESEVMSRAYAVWQNIWPEETQLSRALAKCGELVREEDAVKRGRLMEELEGLWGPIKEWIEHTTVRDLKHHTYQFTASLAGYCILQGAYYLNSEMARYDEILEKWRTYGGTPPPAAMEERQRWQKEAEELVNEQDSREHSDDSWGITGIVDAAEDFYREDLYFYAACVFAGGLPYEMGDFETGQPEKFREFWNTWLWEAFDL